MKIHSLLTLNPLFYLELSASITATLVYISGFGRFRFVLVYAIYLIVRAIFLACSTNNIKDIVLVPIIVLSLIFDLKFGAFYPVYDLNNILLAAILLVICDATVRNVIQKKIDNIKSLDHFQICPNCRCLHSELVSSCNKCGYKESKFGSKKSEATLLNKIINAKNEDGIDHEEAILYQMSLPRTIAFYRNGNRELRNHLFMTKDSVAIVELHGEKAWRDSDVIPYDDITAITGEMKKSFISKCPFLTIKCNNGNIFELVLSSFDEYKQQIMQVQSVAKNANEKILIENNLPDKPAWRM